MPNNTFIIPNLKKIIPENAESILCIGCGHHGEGFFEDEEMRKNHDILEACFSEFDITGIDAFPRAIEYREQFGPKGNYILGNAKDLSSLVDRKFDVVLCHHVIEHLLKDDGHKLIKDCEDLSNLIVIMGAPKGFVKSGDSSNEYMSHLSGWEPEEFIGYDINLNTQGVFLVSKEMKSNDL